MNESRRGISGHNQSPYFIAHQNADEKSGDVYFATLAYSGNFKVKAERDLFGHAEAFSHGALEFGSVNAFEVGQLMPFQVE